MALALLMNQRMALDGVWRTLILLPVVIPQSISAIIWGVALRPDGPINAVLVALGLPEQGFLTSTTQAMPSLMVVVSWVGCGYWMTFLLAGLKDIPVSLYEAARLDGANRWQQLWNITLPMLRRPLLFVLVADTVANFLVFAPVQILTGGGPEETTNLIMSEIYHADLRLWRRQGRGGGDRHSRRGGARRRADPVPDDAGEGRVMTQADTVKSSRFALVGAVLVAAAVDGAALLGADLVAASERGHLPLHLGSQSSGCSCPTGSRSTI
ncbi:MAG: sugar ABC transporter permease [Candidatus Kaistia colombiensis]|nr:MAG: sugar ABC transporter permease [Kaistia sp.]